MVLAAGSVAVTAVMMVVVVVLGLHVRIIIIIVIDDKVAAIKCCDTRHNSPLIMYDERTANAYMIK